MKTRLDAWFWLYEWPNVRINWRLLFLSTQMTMCGHVCLEMVIKQNFLLHLACLAQSLTWRLILRKMVTKSTSRYTFYCSHVNNKKILYYDVFAINKYIACFYHVYNLYSSHHESSSVLLSSVSFDNNCEHPYYYDVKYHCQKAIILADELQFNPLPPNISIYNLLTIYYTFPNVLTKRICSIIKSCFSWWSSRLFSRP